MFNASLWLWVEPYERSAEHLRLGHRNLVDKWIYLSFSKRHICIESVNPPRKLLNAFRISLPFYYSFSELFSSEYRVLCFLCQTLLYEHLMYLDDVYFVNSIFRPTIIFVWTHFSLSTRPYMYEGVLCSQVQGEFHALLWTSMGFNILGFVASIVAFALVANYRTTLGVGLIRITRVWVPHLTDIHFRKCWVP